MLNHRKDELELYKLFANDAACQNDMAGEYLAE
jgi:hypothetical protein